MSQIVLALDTSTPVLSAALVRCAPDGTVEPLDQRRVAPPAVTSTVVPSLFEEMLQGAALTLNDVDVLVTGIGPGLFTGVRVAVATMKAIAYARKKPLIGAESLEAMAQEASATARQTLLCPALDARKGEAYWALYRAGPGGWVAELPPRASSRVALLEELSQRSEQVLLFGSGASGVTGTSQVQVLPAPVTPSAFEIARLALRKTPHPTFDAAAVLALEPFYLRPPEAEVARKQRELKAASTDSP